MNVKLVEGYQPGAIGRVTEMHARYYSEEWGLGLSFETKVAKELADFFRRYDEARDRFWMAQRDGESVGSITIDGSEENQEGARLRFFITSDGVRGQGVGNLLIDAAMAFCRQARFHRVFLWTFDGLSAARHLYERHGFRIAEQIEGVQWGKPLTEQKMVLEL